MRQERQWWAAAAGLAASAATVVLARALGAAPVTATASAVVAAATAVTVRARFGWHVGRAEAARLIESVRRGLDNLIVTAVWVEAADVSISRRMRDEILRQADERAADLDPRELVPQRRARTVCGWVAAGLVALVVAGPRHASPPMAAPQGIAAQGALIASMRVTTVPPSYTGLQPQVLDAPTAVRVAAGGRVEIAIDGAATTLTGQAPGEADRQSVRGEAGAPLTLVFDADRPRTLALVATAGDRPRESRLLAIDVAPDAEPSVRITAPARDMAFPRPDAVIELAIEARDDLGLGGLALGFTRLSGAGEAFTFAEGRLPLEVERVSATEWRARARWALASLRLDDGDSLVYRAIARDTNPGGHEVTSDAFTVDIGKRAELATAGFGLSDNEQKYGISQQMVIVKSERLQAARAKYDAEGWAEQTKLLAVEQRMVRAEVVFLSGGEVQDETVEAAQSSEVTEGRLQNAGRAEMLRAITFMSRAEASLNGGSVREALVHERAALSALQKAFDRRRYFLRTLPERARIDLSRRLTGRLTTARPRARPAPDADSENELAAARGLMRDLASVASGARPVDPAFAARLASVDGARPALRDAAARLLTAASGEARSRAAAQAMAALASHVRPLLGPSAMADLPTDPLAGYFTDALRRSRGRP
jgi:hypothetical protein